MVHFLDHFDARLDDRLDCTDRWPSQAVNPRHAKPPFDAPAIGISQFMRAHAAATARFEAVYVTVLGGLVASEAGR
jgi:hypothetical protein